MVEIIQTDNNPNHISFGLTITPDNRVIVTPIPEGKAVVNSAALCPAEPNPDFLPVVGLRTRRFNEAYPYEAVQGYRSGNEVEVRTYLQPDYARPLPPPARVVTYMLQQAFEYPDLSEHGLKAFNGANLSLQIGQGVIESLSYGGISINGSSGYHYGIKSDSPAQWNQHYYTNDAGVELRHWIGQSASQITTMRLDADFDEGGGPATAKIYLDVVRYFTIDDANGRIVVDVYLINPSATESVINCRVNEQYHNLAFYEISGSGGAAVFNRGYGSIPTNRLVRSAADASPFTELGIYTPNQAFDVNCIVDSNYTSDPDVILAGIDGPPGDSYAELAMAWDLGDIGPGQVRHYQYYVIAGTNPAVMYAGLS